MKVMLLSRRLNNSFQTMPTLSPSLLTSTRSDYGGRLTPTGTALSMNVISLLVTLGYVCHTCGLSSTWPFAAGGSLLSVLALIAALSNEGNRQSTSATSAGGQSIMVWLLVFEVAFFLGALWVFGLSRVNALEGPLTSGVLSRWSLYGQSYQESGGVVAMPHGVASHTLVTDLIIQCGEPKRSLEANRSEIASSPFTGCLATNAGGLLLLVCVSLVLHAGHRLCMLSLSKVVSSLTCIRSEALTARHKHEQSSGVYDPHGGCPLSSCLQDVCSTKPNSMCLPVQGLEQQEEGGPRIRANKREWCTRGIWTYTPHPHYAHYALPLPSSCLV